MQTLLQPKASSQMIQLRPMPDEMPFGLIMATANLLGIGNMGGAFKILLNSSNLSPVSPLHRGSLKFAERYLFGEAFDPDLFVRNHSFLPYFTCFLSESVLQNVAESVRMDRGVGIRYSQVITKTIEQRIWALQTCRHCLTEQQNDFRRTSWLRSHNLPRVSVCYRHGAPLDQGKIALRMYSRVEGIAFPDSDLTQTREISWSAGSPWIRESPEWLFAQVSHDILSRIGLIHAPKAWEIAYTNMFGEIFGRRQKYCLHELSILMARTYGSAFPRTLGISFSNSIGVHWLLRLMGEYRANVVVQPMLHALMMGALFDSATSTIDYLTEANEWLKVRARATSQLQS